MLYKLDDKSEVIPVHHIEGGVAGDILYRVEVTIMGFRVMPGNITFIGEGGRGQELQGCSGSL